MCYSCDILGQSVGSSQRRRQMNMDGLLIQFTLKLDEIQTPTDIYTPTKSIGKEQ